MLIAKGKISREMIAMLSTWRHPGFHVFCGNRIQPRERIISFIENRAVIKTILQYLGIWTIRSRPPAKAHAPPSREYAAEGFRHTAFHDDAYGDPNYSWDAYITT